MRAVVLGNGSAGSLTGADGRDVRARIGPALRAAGIEAELRSVRPDELARAARDAAGHVDAVLVAGGDGTVNAVAGALVGGDTPLGVLPLGTFNHFAKDLRMPLDLDQAAAALAAGRVQAVDVGEVNDRVFVNNSSIGIYPIVVEDRDEQRRRHGRSKPVAMLRATLDVLRRAHTLTVTLRSDEGSRSLETPFVVVANNAYEMGLFAIARRGSLDGGELSVYVAEHTNRLGLAALMLRALVGRLEHADQLDTMCLEELEIDCPRRPLRVSLDGEVVRLATPLRYRVRPGALKVLVPPDA